MKIIDPAAAFRELRDLVAAYLEGSADADRATELLAALDPSTPIVIPAEEPLTEAQKDRQRDMFGLTTNQLDEVLQGKSRRDVAMYAMGTLSNAQEYIRQRHDGEYGWTVAEIHANTIRRLINVAKYAIDKAAPR